MLELADKDIKALATTADHWTTRGFGIKTEKKKKKKWTEHKWIVECQAD